MTFLSCNGQPVEAALAPALLVNYGHFSSMQVRGGRVQGLERHLQRLQQATRQLFGSSLDLAQLRQWMRAALDAAQAGDASLRVTVFSTGFDFRQPTRVLRPDVLVAVSPPVAPSMPPMSVRPVHYQREFPAIKHVGTFALFQHRRLAIQAGFDDAVFIGPDQILIEGSTWNIALGQGAQVVWPQADSLPGICQALLQAGLAAAGEMSGVRPVVLADLQGFDAAVACNASGLRPITAIGERVFPHSAALCERLSRHLAGAAWEAL